MKESVQISAVIITLNEVSKIRQCLESVKFCDEVIVVDSGSSDGTCELAASLGAKVIHQDWLGYGGQKQFAVDQASNEWVLCIDADERVSGKLRESIINTMQTPGFNAFMMPRCNRFLGKWLRHGEGYPDKSLRLFDRRYARWSDDAVHEKVICKQVVGELKGDLLHESQETLEIYLNKQNRYTTLQAQRLHLSGKKTSFVQLLLSPLVRFFKFYIFKRGILDGIPGLVHISIGCMNTFMKYAKLLELQKKGFS